MPRLIKSRVSKIHSFTFSSFAEKSLDPLKLTTELWLLVKSVAYDKNELINAPINVCV